jgi:hypothetical protein
MKASGNMRDHFRSMHPNDDILALERSFIMTRYPDLDLDAVIQDYLAGKESIWTLKKNGFRLAAYFRHAGIRKTYGEEIKAHRFLKFGSHSVYDNPNWVASMMAKYGTMHPQQSPEVKDKRLTTLLKKDGLEDLLEPTKVLRELKKRRRAAAKAKKEAEKAESVAENPEKT